VTTVQQQQAEQMRVYWKVRFTFLLFGIRMNAETSLRLQFIEGMLTNLGPLPLDRIQSMMKKVLPGYDRTVEQLAGFLEAARREGVVAGHDGVWRLNT
jgi:anaphase-promoting complex subunit 2